MSNLRGMTVAVAADGVLAAALARRLAQEGARIVLGSPASEKMEETLAELRWECARVLWRRLDPLDPTAAEQLAAFAETAYGPLDAVVSWGPFRRGDVLSRRVSGSRRPLRVVRLAAGRRREALDPCADDGLRVTTIMTHADSDFPASPEAVAEASAFALAGPGDVEVGSLVLRPLAQAA